MGRQDAMNHAKISRGFTGLAMLALAAVSVAPPLLAQNPGGAPARAVRLSFVDGQVKLLQGTQVLADPALANTPLFEGMQLSTGDTGKAEIQFEDGSVARLSPDSSVTIAALRGQGTAGDAQLAVNSGLAYFELQGGSVAGKITVLFGGSAATASGFTVLRVDLDNPPGALAVFSGNAHLQIDNSGNSADLHGGESIALNAANPSAYQLSESIEPDSWDAFNSDRDQALTTEAATQTTASADMGQSHNPAWSDLDANGNWYNVPGQGYIWSPYDAANAGFDPYGNGNWMFTPGYGYIWASAYPWGYMPFQCGAWNFYNSFGWGWAPGMGGCNPWWGLGFYGGPNIGYAPGGYIRIARPITPGRLPGRGPIPVFPVHRAPFVQNSAFNGRNVNRPVVINGTKVEALRPVPSQSVTNRAPAVMRSNGLIANKGGQTPAPGAQPAVTRPAYSFTRPANGPSSQTSGANSNAQHQSFWGGNSQNNSGNTAGGNGSAQHSNGNSGGGSPHPSGGAPSGGYSGGGGGGSHPSGGGGGGGGGGASHSSGGGGGGGGGGSGHH
jgi:hypothetical protein